MMAKGKTGQVPQSSARPQELNQLPLISKHGRKKLLAVYRDGLLKDTVPFWFPRSVDTQHGGFFSALDRDGTLVDTDKSVWVQGRMTWMLLTLFNTVEKRSE